MTSRFSLGILSAVLALASAAPLRAAPAASATASVASITYHIERHNQQVIVKDANGKTLVMCTAVTPTIQGVLTEAVPSSGTASANRIALHQLLFTLEDQTDHRLWSTLVPVISANHLDFKYNTDMSGSQIVIGHQAEGASNSSQPPLLRLVLVIGPDGRPVSMSDGHETYNIAVSPKGTSFTGQDGKVLVQTHVSPNNSVTFVTPDATGSATAAGTGIEIILNEAKVAAKTVTKDGKTYLSFPWNGHNVLVEQPCTINFTSSGDLTINTSKTGTTSISASSVSTN